MLFGAFLSILLITSAQADTVLSRRYSPNSSARWETAIRKARELASQMTLEELNNATYGVPSTCSGLSGSVPRLGYDGLCYEDLMKSDLISSFPEGISVAASWNTDLAYQRGQSLGYEWHKKGAKIGLSPVVGPLGRIALGGRNMEGLGADPVLSGKLSAASIIGIQEFVGATAKHFIGNEQEGFRVATSGSSNNFSVSSNIDDKDMHELYLWPFQESVAAGVVSVMCSYNRINESYACENDKLLNGLLKTELNYQGLVVTDWTFAQKTGLGSALAGSDVAMPSSPGLWDNSSLVAAVNNGSLSRDRLEDMVARQIAASFYIFGNQTSSPPNGYGFVADYLEPHELVDARDPTAKPKILQQAIQGHVLVKNQNAALPLQSPKILSLFGFDGKAQSLNNPGQGLLSNLWTSAVQNVNASLADLATALGGGFVTTFPLIASLGTAWTATGSGSNLGSYISDPYSAISQRAYEEDIYLWWDFDSFKPDVSSASSACLVFLNDFSTEAADRTELADSPSDDLVLHVASRCSNTIVVIHNTFTRVLDTFYDHENVTAIMLAHLPGQDSGRALVKLLFGDVSPSGRLPYTVPKNATDFGNLLEPSLTPVENPQSNFSDPSAFDYRYFQNNDIEPRLPFGFGLTYTTFSYGNEAIIWDGFSTANMEPQNPEDRIPGGLRSLFETLAIVSTTVTNTGNTTAAEVVQVYVQHPGEKVHVLRAFDKQVLVPGQTKTFTFELARKDLSRWDVVSQQWLLPSGKSVVKIGSSSADIKSSLELIRQ